MKNHSRFDCGRLSKIFDCKISVKTIFKMNSLYLISLTVLVVMISYVNTTNTPVENSQVSDNCQKNLIKKNCSSCGDVCISVDKNLLSNWTNNIIDLLVSAEGVEMFESYLRACNLNESMDRMELWKKSNVILPYRDHRDSEADYADNLKRTSEQMQYQLFLFKNGKHVPNPKNKLHYIRILQNNIRDSLTEDYVKFQRKLLNDKEELKHYSQSLCRNN